MGILLMADEWDSFFLLVLLFKSVCFEQRYHIWKIR